MLPFKTDTFMAKLLSGKAVLRYDPVTDILLILFSPMDEVTIVHYITDNLGLLYKEGTLEVVGLQIESIFELIRLEDLLENVTENTIHGEFKW